jgi:hypothetical protein
MLYLFNLDSLDVTELPWTTNKFDETTLSSMFDEQILITEDETNF